MNNAGNRRLLAIMFVDVVGFTKMMAMDESFALSILESSLASIKTKVEDYRGHWLKQVGDGALISFGSVYDAVLCAGDIQQEFSTNEQISFRIGIHIGDVISEESDILGDGVNVASRLQAEAPENGICISDAVYDALSSHSKLSFIPKGDKQLKGLNRTIKIFLVDFSGQQQRFTALQILDSKNSFRLGFILLIFLFSVGLIYHQYSSQSLDDEYSIAVLPFDDFSHNKDLDYFTEGMAEELLNVLARIPVLSVASRTSTSILETKGKTVPQIASELKVKYLIEGSVRNTSKGIRVTVQIIDGQSNSHLFSNVYDSELNRVVEIQEKVSFSVGHAFEDILKQDFSAYLLRSTNVSDNSKAYVTYLKGVTLLNNYTNSADLDDAERLFYQSMEEEPNYAKGLAGLCRLNAVRFGLLATNDNTKYIRATEYCKQALAYDSNWLEVQLALIELYLIDRNIEHAKGLLSGLKLAYPNNVEVKRLGVEVALQSKRHDEAKIALIDLVAEYPSDIRFWKTLAIIYIEQADWKSAIGALEKARAVSPANTVILSNLGGAYFFLGEFEKAKTMFLGSLEIKREPWIINNLGTIHYFEHDYDTALKYFFEYLEINQEDHVVYASIADTLFQLNDEEQAKFYYSKALEKASSLNNAETDSDLKANIAYYRARLGQRELVRELLMEIDLKKITSDGAYYSALASHVIENNPSRTEFVSLAIEKGYPDFLIKKDPILKTKDLP